VVVETTGFADRLAVLPNQLRRNHRPTGQQVEQRVIHRTGKPERRCPARIHSNRSGFPHPSKKEIGPLILPLQSGQINSIRSVFSGSVESLGTRFSTKHSVQASVTHLEMSCGFSIPHARSIKASSGVGIIFSNILSAVVSPDRRSKASSPVASKRWSRCLRRSPRTPSDCPAACWISFDVTASIRSQSSRYIPHTRSSTGHSSGRWRRFYCVDPPRPDSPVDTRRAASVSPCTRPSEKPGSVVTLSEERADRWQGSSRMALYCRPKGNVHSRTNQYHVRCRRSADCF